MADVSGLGGPWFTTGSVTLSMTSSGTATADIIGSFEGGMHDYHFLISRSVAGVPGVSSRIQVIGGIIGGFASNSTTQFQVTQFTVTNSAAGTFTGQLTGNNPPNIPPFFGVRVTASNDTNSNGTVTIFAGIYGSVDAR